jgi:hypothetical protein
MRSENLTEAIGEVGGEAGGVFNTTERAIGAGSQLAIGAGFLTDTYWSAPILANDTYEENKTGTFSLAQAKKKIGSARIELSSLSTITASSPELLPNQIKIPKIPKSPNHSQIATKIN